MIKKHYKGVSTNCFHQWALLENQCRHASSVDSEEEYFESFSNWDSTDPKLPPPLQFQLFTFLRALCITRRDWLWLLKQNPEWLTSRCDIVENVKAGQSARCQMKATNYLANQSHGAQVCMQISHGKVRHYRKKYFFLHWSVLRFWTMSLSSFRRVGKTVLKIHI